MLSAGSPAATVTMQADRNIRSDEPTFDCPICDHQRVVRGPDGTATCPNCRESYSLVVREGFVLMETDGWATRLALAPDAAER